MRNTALHFWAKTTSDGRPGISVHDHCLNVGCVAEAIINALPLSVRSLLPIGAGTLAALHDVGKITIGFQAKCHQWLLDSSAPPCSSGEIALSVTDHALVSQFFLENIPTFSPARLWAVAVGSHHGRPKGKRVRLNAPEALADWANEHRGKLLERIQTTFGPLPTIPPDSRYGQYYSDIWLLAGLITFADWIGSNEVWFSPEKGLPVKAARQQARKALDLIGWPGGRLGQTDFPAAFSTPAGERFQPNALQCAVAEASRIAQVIIVEGPMGCGKTEAALFAAQQQITSGKQQGIYFALPTQVTSNRIRLRIEQFLRNTLVDVATLRLAHGNAWLEDDFDLRINPSFDRWNEKDGIKPIDDSRDARSWFASAKQALLAPYGVGTIDQALQSVVAVKHFFVRRFALAGKVVILDEVHSYDIYTGTLITALIRELVNLQCSVIILSATLTAARRHELLEAAQISETEGSPKYPVVTYGNRGENCFHSAPKWDSRRSIVVRSEVISEQETIEELIRRAESGQHVLWIRNTVIEAQQSFRTVSGSIRQDTVQAGLLHSRFPFHRRAELENEWLERLGKNRPETGTGSILIATQVVEQSVDIDLDFMVSDLAPTDMLLQRVGRLWRHPRSGRQAVQPEFWIRLPEFAPETDPALLKKALGRTSRVYAPYVLLRTYTVWQEKATLDLPDDIRPMLEATYAEPDNQEPDAWKALHAELQSEKAKLAANAQAATLVLGRPMLQDEDAILTRCPGAPTIPLVLLRSITITARGLVTVVALDGSELEISEFEWRMKSARFLQYWTVRAPRWMVPASAPKAVWLTLHGPPGATFATVQDNGRCLFGGNVSAINYDPRLGIFAERPISRPTQPMDDDEFDY